tara:strand:+ start:693 stop:815 length:123 start_codon:yes stop_codon:yes gene_type:complete
MGLKKEIFKLKRLLQEITLLKKNYYNWDGDSYFGYIYGKR